MAWTAPRDWTAISGGIVTAASLNTDVRDNLGVLSTHTHTGADGMGAANLDDGLTLASLVTLTFADQSANPDAAGELQRNGNDLLFYGSSAVNLTAADASAGTASLRTLGTTSVTAAAGNHQHSFADLTPVTDDVDEGGAAGDREMHVVGLELAGSTAVNIDITHTPTTDVAVVAFAAVLLQAVSYTVQTLEIKLFIDGVSVDSQTNIHVADTQSSLLRLTGMRAMGSGAITVRLTITNHDASDAAEYVAWVSALSVSI